MKPDEKRRRRHNPRIRVRSAQVLSDDWFVLRKTIFDYRRNDGTWVGMSRETYDRGNGATVLLYDLTRRTVLLTRQFRYAAYANGHEDGMLVETPAGFIGNGDPATEMRREALEETGHTLNEMDHVFDVYLSPGSLTERLHCYASPYSPATLTTAGGGVAAEGEDIEVEEIPFDDALGMVASGKIVDAKTILLLQWAALRGPFREFGSRDREPA